MNKKIIFGIILVFICVIVGFSLINADVGNKCSSNSDCKQTEFCELQNCTDKEGVCALKPNSDQCEPIGTVCGCDQNTYPSDCHRQSAGVSKNYKGECLEQISIYNCKYQGSCSGDLECIEFPGIGVRCAKPNPCSYFNCSEISKSSVCVLEESFYWDPDTPYYPFKLSCVGDCDSDDNCEMDEFCDFHPCDLEAGYCTKIPTECPDDNSPVCGCDGKTYMNDCLRNKTKVSKNYDGSCIQEISNVSCNVDDYYKDTCDFIGSCVNFPGIGRRCAVDPIISEYYSCPEGFEYLLQLTYPYTVICKKSCTSDKDCGSTDYVEYACSLSKKCDSLMTPEECKLIPCGTEVNGQCLIKYEPCPDYYAPVCGCDGITYKNTCFLMEAGIVKNYSGECTEGVNITEITCSLENPCPEGLDLDCFSFPGLGLRCAKPNPCSYYDCPKDTECLVLETYPGTVRCSLLEIPAGDEQGVPPETSIEYNVITGEVEIRKYDRVESVDITVRQSVEGNRGILDTEAMSVEYSGKLEIEDSKLFMETSVGKRSINILPEDAVMVSETPNIDLVKEIWLKEELQKPIYFIKGIQQKKIFFLFSVSVEVETKINAETGDILSIKKPWWSFLAW